MGFIIYITLTNHEVYKVPNRENLEKNHKVAEITLQFIEQYKTGHYDCPPTFKQMATHLNDIGLSANRGGKWGHSSVQKLLDGYCRRTNTPYPLKRRSPKATTQQQEITITLKITVAHSGDVKVVVE